jgi:hypothetical protein
MENCPAVIESKVDSFIGLKKSFCFNSLKRQKKTQTKISITEKK